MANKSNWQRVVTYQKSNNRSGASHFFSFNLVFFSFAIKRGWYDFNRFFKKW